MNKTNFDRYLEQQLQDPAFAARFERAGKAWDVALQIAALRQQAGLSQKVDFCPAFWAWLIQANTAKQVFSIEKVSDEIQAIADELADWATNRGDDFFLKPDANLLPALSTVSRWAAGQSYKPAAVNTFSSCCGLASGRLCARIRTYGRNTRDSFAST